jgi:hypothetical protein
MDSGSKGQKYKSTINGSRIERTWRGSIFATRWLRILSFPATTDLLKRKKEKKGGGGGVVGEGGRGGG